MMEMHIFWRRPTPLFRVNRGVRAVLSAMLLPVLLTACGESARPMNDAEQIVQAVLAQQAVPNRPVCLDDSTQDNALDVYREMIVAPRPARRELKWYPPLPLDPEARVTTRALRRTELGNDTIRIEEPEPRRDFLPGLTQLELDGTARRMLRSPTAIQQRVAIRQSWTPKGVTARWWPLNRIRKSCWPLFEVSDPVRDRGMAFVTVRAEHWGVLYALKKTGARWQPIAEWSRWLY
ncbi:MAG TPA: hypothetical protein VF649_01790 [Sphingomonas sp.]